jgi:hypothetical protein
MRQQIELHTGLAQLRASDFSPIPELERRLQRHWESLTFDEFIALEAAGHISVDFAGQYGLTMEKLIEIAQSHPDEELRANARIIIAASLEMMQSLWVKFPVQMDLMTVWRDRTHGADCAVWRAAMDRTIQRISWKIRTQQERIALARRAANTVHTVKDEQRAQTQAAIMLALSDLDRRQPIRFGRSWVRDATEGKAQVQPGCLEWQYLWRWLCKEVPRIAKASLLDKDSAPDVRIDGRSPTPDAYFIGIDAVDEAETAAINPQKDPLLVVCHREKYRDLLTALDRAPKRERELAALLQSGATLSQSAATMGISYKTASELQHRLRTRLRDIKAS